MIEAVWLTKSRWPDRTSAMTCWSTAARRRVIVSRPPPQLQHLLVRPPVRRQGEQLVHAAVDRASTEAGPRLDRLAHRYDSTCCPTVFKPAAQTNPDPIGVVDLPAQDGTAPDERTQPRDQLRRRRQLSSPSGIARRPTQWPRDQLPRRRCFGRRRVPSGQTSVAEPDHLR